VSELKLVVLRAPSCVPLSVSTWVELRMSNDVEVIADSCAVDRPWMCVVVSQVSSVGLKDWKFVALRAPIWVAHKAKTWVSESSAKSDVESAASCDVVRPRSWVSVKEAT
jgi:hypothetical protein